jgi:hypothetical protein
MSPMMIFVTFVALTLVSPALVQLNEQQQASVVQAHVFRLLASSVVGQATAQHPREKDYDLVQQPLLGNSPLQKLIPASRYLKR